MWLSGPRLKGLVPLLPLEWCRTCPRQLFLVKHWVWMCWVGFVALSHILAAVWLCGNPSNLLCSWRDYSWRHKNHSASLDKAQNVSTFICHWKRMLTHQQQAGWME